MTPSTKCISLIKSFEQCRLKAYLPTLHDVPTIGWGSTGADIRLGVTWTQNQADERFDRDIARFARGVSVDISTAPTTQDQFDALVSFSYNVGEAAFQDSTLLRKHHLGDYVSAAKEFLRWDKQKGVTLAGLTRRRVAEAKLYKGEM